MKTILLFVFSLLPLISNAAGTVSFTNYDEEGARWIEAHVEGVDTVYGMEVELYYPSDSLVPIDLSPSAAGPQIIRGDFFDEGAYEITNNIDVRSGRIRYGLSLLKPAEAVSGNGMLFKLGFKTQSNDAVAMEVAKIQFGTQQGSIVNVDYLPEVEIAPAFSQSTGKFTTAYRAGSKTVSAASDSTSESGLWDVLNDNLVIVLFVVIILLLLAVIGLLLRRPVSMT